MESQKLGESQNANSTNNNNSSSSTSPNDTQGNEENIGQIQEDTPNANDIHMPVIVNHEIERPESSRPLSASSQKPGSVSSQRPGSASSQGPVNGSSQRPGSSSSLRPGSASSQGPVNGSSQRPGSSSSLRPGSASSQRPGSVSSQRPGSASSQGPVNEGSQRPGSPSLQSLVTGTSGRPDSASSQRPGSASLQGPVNGGSQRPGSASSQRPGSASSQRPGPTGSQRPGSASSQRPGSVSSQRPGSTSSQRPGSASSQTPGSVSSQGPVTGGSQGPESTSLQSLVTGTSGRPDSGSFQRPGSASFQGPVNGVSQRPGSASSQRPGSASTQRPGSVSSLRPGSTSSQRPGSASSQRPGSANSQRPGSASSQRPGSASSQQSASAGLTKSQIINSVEVEALQAQSRESVPAGRRASAVTILDMEADLEEMTESVFSPELEAFPVMPSSDNLFVIEEDEEGEKLQTIEEFSKDMGREGEQITTPRDQVDLPKLLEDLHAVPTQLATEDPPKELLVDQRIPETVGLQLEVSGKDNYLYEFEQEVKEDVLMIGNISLDEIKAEEQRLREEHVRFQDMQARLHKERKDEVERQKEGAKDEVREQAKRKREELARKEKQIALKRRLYHSEVQTAYRKSQSQLMYALKTRKAEVETMYGDLILADSQYGGNNGRRWKVDWNKAPQPVQIKLRCLRGIKDKLPGGRYVVLVSMYDRIGGHVMRWSNLTGQQWSGSTLPICHDGAFHSIELPVDQSVFTVCPSVPDIRPSMVFVFEVFLLRGPMVPTDRVVAWGAFPLCDKECSVIEGRYKCPLLRGEVDNRVQSHDKIERLIATDIDNWLCNLYFEVIKLPRYMGGQKEFEVELQFTSSLLGYPDRLQDAEPPKDGNPPILDGAVESGSVMGYEPGDVSTTEESGGDQMLDSMLPDGVQVDMNERRGTVESQRADAHATQIARPFTAAQEMMSEVDESERQEDPDNDYENEFKEVQDKEGLYYKIHRENPMQSYQTSLYKLLPRTNLMKTNVAVKKTLTSAEELAEYKFAVQVPFCDHHKRKKVTHERFRFLYLQMLTEVGVSKFRTPEFWTLIFFLFVAGLGRMLLHYVGQYVLLRIWDTPVTKFTPKWYTCELIYFSETLNYFKIIALVLMGPLTNIMFFIGLVTTAAVSYRLAGYFPNMASQFISAFGVMTFFDWFIVLIVDSITGRYEPSTEVGMEGIVGDAFKLYEIFDRKENNGLVGAFLTIFIYFFLSFLSGVIFYMYYLRIHLNGRLLDIFVRLTGKNEDFFVPHDLEISHAELDFIVTKAEQWRGEEGERRKTAIYDYVWEEEITEEWEDTASRDVEKFKMDATTHVSIHTLHLDGLRELFRHFLRLSDGAILEVFGEAGYLGLDEAVKSQLKDKFDDMEVQVNTTLNRATTAKHRSLNQSRATLLSRTSSRQKSLIGSRVGSRVPSVHSRAASRPNSAASRASVRSRQSVKSYSSTGKKML
ncbi:hypothetical protein ACHWQZ_G018108 [Mnemiopsis leidyi]